MKFKMSNEPLSIFQYASLTDVIFLLMIFFLLTSQFVMLTGVKVKLPSSKVDEQTTPSKLVVTLTSEGGIYVANEQIGIEGLPAKFNSIKGTSREDNLVIRADKTVPIDLVIKVIDAAKAADIGKFTIETEKEKL